MIGSALLLAAQSQPTYQQLMAQGESMRTQHRLPEAAEAYGKAAVVAIELKQAARARYRAAQTYEDLHDTESALSWYHSSLDRAYYPETAEAIKRLESALVGRIVTATEITRSLNLPPARSQGISPSIDLHINFDFDTDRLNSEGDRQVAELAHALAYAGFANDRFVLVGHTDKRGTDDYNFKLSERRALRVREVLGSDFGLDVSRFDVKGMGRTKLLSDGDTEEDHSINRRVEVRLLRGSRENE